MQEKVARFRFIIFSLISRFDVPHFLFFIIAPFPLDRKVLFFI